MPIVEQDDVTYQKHDIPKKRFHTPLTDMEIYELPKKISYEDPIAKNFPY